MFNGLKARRRLAVYVALGLSAGSCTCLDASSAYAADVVVGVGEDQSGDVVGSDASNNTVTIGAEGGGDHPVIGGNVAGANSTTDTSGNVVTIHSIKATASGHGTIYGGIAVGTASGNKVTFNGGTAPRWSVERPRGHRAVHRGIRSLSPREICAMYGADLPLRGAAVPQGILSISTAAHFPRAVLLSAVVARTIA